MNRYECAFLRVVLGWGFRPTADGFELWTPISLDHAPQVLGTFKLDWGAASMLDVADLVHAEREKAETLHLHTSFGLEEVESVLRSAQYPTLDGWLEGVNALGIAVGMFASPLTNAFGVSLQWFNTQSAFCHRYPKAFALTLVPLENGGWTVCERHLCDDYGVHGHPGSTLIGWWADTPSSLQTGGLETFGVTLQKELVLWLCQHPFLTEEKVKNS